MQRFLQLGRPVVVATAVILVIGLFLKLAVAQTETVGDSEVSSTILELLESGSAAEAKDLAWAHYRETKMVFGPDSRETADTLDLLVECLYRGGDHRKPLTRALGEKAVALREELHGATHPAVARSVYRLARVYYFDARLEKALELAQRALEIRMETLGGEDPEVAESLRFLGTLYEEQGELERGKGLLEESLKIRERSLGPSHPDVADSLNYLANCLFRMGDYEQALSLYARAQEISEIAFGRVHARVAKALYNQALVLSILGDYQEARALYEKSVQIHLASLGPDHPNVFIARSGLASVMQLLGDFASARAQYELVLEGIERTFGADQLYYASSLSSLGLLFQAGGQIDEALEVQRRALQIRTDALGQSHPEVAASLSVVASLHAEKAEWTSARAMYTKALQIQESALGNEHPEIANTLSGLAGTFQGAGEIQLAASLYERAIDIYEETLGRDHPSLIGPLMGLGELLSRAGEPERSLEVFGRSLQIANEVAGEEFPETAKILNAEARALARLERWDEAFSVAIRGAAIARTHVRATARVLPEREALAYARYMKDNLDLLLEIAARHSEGVEDAAARAWDSLIRSRALVLDEMATRNRIIDESSDPETRRLSEEYRSAGQRLANLLVRGPADLSLESYRKLWVGARKEKELAELALADRSLRAGEREELRGKGLEQVRQGLPPGSAIVAYAVSDQWKESRIEQATRDSFYLAFVLRFDGLAPEVQFLGDRQLIDELVGEWRAVLSRGDPSSARGQNRETGAHPDSAWSLRQRMWDPVSNYLRGIKRVFVVPEGSLNLVNLAALPAGLSTYLIETGPTFHLLSAERDLIREPLFQKGQGLLAVGAPNFDKKATVVPSSHGSPRELGPPSVSSESTYRTNLSSGERSPSCRQNFESLRFTPLSATLAEIEAVTGLWTTNDRGKTASPLGGVVKLTGEQATESAFKAYAPGRRVLHVATHGFFLGSRCVSEAAQFDGAKSSSASQLHDAELEGNPLHLSGLALAGSNRRSEATDTEDDWILTAEEISALDLSQVEWAVLSACDTGVGAIQAGEGVFGLRRAMTISGARTVVMSLWPVDDRATEEWMRQLYSRRFTDKLDTAEAVRQASLGFLRELRRKGANTSPALWAGFVAAGDWE
ncbi:MAG: CHAT domain-containing tetratricopeptide repeat protein [Thermoanaerobaculia bacterium]